MDNHKPNPDFIGYDERLLANDDRYENELGVPSFNLLSLTTRVQNRPAAFHPNTTANLRSPSRSAVVSSSACWASD